MGVTVRQKVKGKGQPWWVFVCYQGKRISKKVGSKRDAERVASEIRVRLARGEFGFKDQEVPTFGKYVDEWLRTYARHELKPRTRKGYESVINKHLKPRFGPKRLDQITRPEFRKFLYEKLNEDPAANTVKNIKVVMGSIMSSAVEDGLIPDNPASRLGRIFRAKAENNEIRPLTFEEAATFLETCKTYFPKYYPFFLLLLRTGMRLGEALALKWEDIDFHGGFIEVRRSASLGKITIPKSGRTRRVEMSRHLAQVLKDLLTQRKREALQKGWGEVPEWVFCNERGNMINQANLRHRVFHKILERAGLRRIRIHDLRHTYATHRILLGHSIARVSRDLGHASIKITVDTYYHWLPVANEKREVDDLDALDCTLYAPRGTENGRDVV